MYLPLLAAAWGATLGWLVPRVAYRLAVEAGEPWRGACPEGHALTRWLGPPVCRQRGARRWAAATATAAATLATTTGPRPELAVWLLLLPPAGLLAAVDARVHRLPDVLTIPLAATAAALLGAAALAPHHQGSWRHALLGGLALGGAYFVLFLINPAGLGFGDVKLAVGLGVVLGWYGWGTLFTGAFAGFAAGGTYGLGLILARRADRRAAIPFGPFMLGGAYLGLLLGGLAA
ncbi:prepilin peptidase [Streptomyces sp. BPTC-684]|uniref:prepilin peptidase n=1 Tax=Streptomyces sp. BPTC-684 TaxID=3043734 RepID=UPI0024B18066|nr:prepilin peptidase [Streptomyces sp. BPTC-684]WHM36866.1 prepilin peptidase [Streptomyces sp. BPTC-684]